MSRADQILNQAQDESSCLIGYFFFFLNCLAYDWKVEDNEKLPDVTPKGMLLSL